MHQALIQNAEHNVDREQRRADEEGLTVQRSLIRRCRPGKKAANRLRHIQPLLHLGNQAGGIAQRHIRRKIERHRYGWKGTGVIDDQRRGAGMRRGDRGERNDAAARGMEVDIL